MTRRWRNRIVGEGEEAPDQLLANPRNWRIHSQLQQESMAAVLDRVGWIDRVKVNRTTGHVLDGHMRVAMAISEGEPTVPVQYLELSEEEEVAALASFDTVGDMAAADRESLRDLLEAAANGGDRSDGIMRFFALVAQEKGITPPGFVPTSLEDQSRLDRKAPIICPSCGHEFVTG